MRKQILFITILLSLFVHNLMAQTSLINRIKDAVTGKALSTTDSTGIYLFNNIASLKSYAGKRINSITIEQHNFSSNIDSQESTFKDFFSKLGNKLHSNSNTRAIRENLFFKEWDLFDPSVIAYNEKWLRDLAYIQDAKITAIPTPYDTNQVDLLVVTKDLFSYGGEVLINNSKAYSAKVNNINLGGTGNSAQFFQNFENDRTPKAGWGYDVGLSNIMGSFISVNAGMNEFGNNMANNVLSARKKYISVQRPILHPNSKWLGGMEYLETNNLNVFPARWEDIFEQQLNYDLIHKDIWIGYQVTKQKKIIKPNEDRKFIQYRHFENNFKERPIDYQLQLDRQKEIQVAQRTYSITTKPVQIDLIIDIIPVTYTYHFNQVLVEIQYPINTFAPCMGIRYKPVQIIKDKVPNILPLNLNMNFNDVDVKVSTIININKTNFSITNDLIQVDKTKNIKIVAANYTIKNKLAQIEQPIVVDVESISYTINDQSILVDPTTFLYTNKAVYGIGFESLLKDYSKSINVQPLDFEMLTYDVLNADGWLADIPIDISRYEYTVSNDPVFFEELNLSRYPEYVIYIDL